MYTRGRQLVIAEKEITSAQESSCYYNVKKCGNVKNKQNFRVCVLRHRVGLDRD